MADSSPAGLSPVVPLIMLGLTLLTAAWASTVLSLVFPATKKKPQPQQPQAAAADKKPNAAPPAPAPTVTKADDSFLTPTRKACILAVSWAVALALVGTGAFGFADDSSLFDPYVILNVTQSTPKADVKRLFRQLSFSLHPDRLVGKSEAEKLEANNKFILISKAYKTLTDDESMKNYLEFGHPDGPRSNSISFGIPEWMLQKENAVIVVALYLLGFGGLVYYAWTKLVPFLESLDLQVPKEGEDEVQPVAPVAATATTKPANKKKL